MRYAPIRLWQLLFVQCCCWAFSFSFLVPHSGPLLTSPAPMYSCSVLTSISFLLLFLIRFIDPKQSVQFDKCNATAFGMTAMSKIGEGTTRVSSLYSILLSFFFCLESERFFCSVFLFLLCLPRPMTPATVCAVLIRVAERKRGPFRFPLKGLNRTRS